MQHSTQKGFYVGHSQMAQNNPGNGFKKNGWGVNPQKKSSIFQESAIKGVSKELPVEAVYVMMVLGGCIS